MSLPKTFIRYFGAHFFLLLINICLIKIRSKQECIPTVFTTNFYEADVSWVWHEVENTAPQLLTNKDANEYSTKLVSFVH